MLTCFDDYDLNITSDTRKAERSLDWHRFQFTCSMFLLPPRLLAPIANRDKRSFDSGLIFAITLGPVYSTLCSGNCCCFAPRNDTILCTSGAHRVQHVGHPAFTCDTSSEKMEWRSCVFYGSYGNFMGNNHSCTLPNDPQQPTRPATMSFLLRMLWIQCKFLSRLLLSTKHLTIPFFRWLSTPLLTWTKGIRCLPQTVLSSSFET